MLNKPNSPNSHDADTKHQSDQPNTYQIRIEGHLDGQWAKRFDGMTITLEENGETLLSGSVVDQAALHSLLRKIRDLGVPLVSVVRLDDAQPDVLEDVPEEFNQ